MKIKTVLKNMTGRGSQSAAQPWN